ncbi:MAG TPA: VWA domain-containing protein, partial [Gemmatimonadaceae bacterium]|nr:VWA domain-containing protein [Gemmatimonadaceae bacterium]
PAPPRRPHEREVERLLRGALAAALDASSAEPTPTDDPAESLAWANARAAQIRAATPRWGYRGIAPVALWGIVRPVPPEMRDAGALPSTGGHGGDAGAGREPARPERSALLQAPQPPDLAQQWEAAMRESIDNPLATMNLGPTGAATDVESATGENVIRSDDASALHEDDAVSAPVDIGDPADRLLRLDTLGTVQYPEWDARAGRLVPRAVTVRLMRPGDADATWATATLREHAPVVRQVRHRFERLRARRMRLSAQREGEELDVAACVRALADRNAGVVADDRLYVAVRPARRPVAILLLVDVSGSTDLPVAGSLRIIDVERTALLLAGEALEAMGDAYAMVAFSGRGAHDVRLSTIKDFAERQGDAVRRRVSALEPRGNTRLGAAVRHATALLARQPAGHRLLLLLSDGQPNDADRYVGDHGVEDSRQAVLEARARGVFPFCLTVDCEGPEYLPRIFGTAHTILRHPEQLPTALLEVVKALVVE